VDDRKSFTCNSVTRPEAIHLTKRVRARVKKLAGASPQTNSGNREEVNQRDSRAIEIAEQSRNTCTRSFITYCGFSRNP
jgi:hypothetical protein